MGDREDELSRLFAEFLEATEQGHEAGDVLVQRAGALGPALQAKIRLHRRLCALSRALDGGAGAGPGRLGRFEILDTLGKGGHGRVYLARDPRLGRRIALKVLERELLLDKDQRAWILNEARARAPRAPRRGQGLRGRRERDARLRRHGAPHRTLARAAHPRMAPRARRR